MFLARNPALRRLCCGTAALATLLLPIFARAADAPSTPPKAEARGVWLHPFSDFSAEPVAGKQEIETFVKQVADANFNFLLPWVLSDYVAALTDTNYQHAFPCAKWDSLGVLISAARQRKLPVHIWYSFTYYKSSSSPEFNPAHAGNPSWAARTVGADKKLTSPKTDACASNPQARQWQLQLMDQLLDRYPDIAGIHIEEPGYGYAGNCGCDGCQALFRQLFGADLLAEISGPQSEDLKCLGTTDFIRQLRARLLKRNPRLIFSVNGGTGWRGDRTLGRDWRRWAEFGWLDYYAAQCYTDNLSSFSSNTQQVIADLSPTPVFAGIHIKSSSGTNPLSAILKEIEIARQHHAAGIILFSGKSLTDEHLSALKSGPFALPALYPETKR